MLCIKRELYLVTRTYKSGFVLFLLDVLYFLTIVVIYIVINQEYMNFIKVSIEIIHKGLSLVTRA